MARSNDHVESFGVVWSVSEWLHHGGAYLVSRFLFFRCFVTDALDPELYRFDLDAVRSTAGSNDPMETFGVGLGWLCESGTSAVSDFIFSCLIDADALNLWSSIFVPRFPLLNIGAYLYASMLI